MAGSRRALKVGEYGFVVRHCFSELSTVPRRGAAGDPGGKAHGQARSAFSSSDPVCRVNGASQLLL